jgi:hypothetical protein
MRDGEAKERERLYDDYADACAAYDAASATVDGHECIAGRTLATKSEQRSLCAVSNIRRVIRRASVEA